MFAGVKMLSATPTAFVAWGESDPPVGFRPLDCRQLRAVSWTPAATAEPRRRRASRCGEISKRPSFVRLLLSWLVTRPESDERRVEFPEEWRAIQSRSALAGSRVDSAGCATHVLPVVGDQVANLARLVGGVGAGVGVMAPPNRTSSRARNRSLPGSGVRRSSTSGSGGPGSVRQCRVRCVACSVRTRCWCSSRVDRSGPPCRKGQAFERRRRPKSSATPRFTAWDWRSHFSCSVASARSGRRR